MFVIPRRPMRIYVMTMARATPHSQATDTESQSLDWNRIYLDLAPRVYNYFRFRLGQESEVEDLTARTFEKAWAAREQYRRDLAGFSTWLFKIAQNLIVDHLRTRRSQIPIDDAVDATATEITEINLERQSDLSRLASLTRELPPRDRELIAL